MEGEGLPPPNIELQSATQEAPTKSLFGKGTPFTHKHVHEGVPADIADEAGITGIVTFAEYHPGGYFPAGLGKWISQRSDLKEIFPPVVGKWMAEPKPGSMVALKISRGDPQANGQLAAERVALYKMNNISPDNADCRPAKLLGYGVARYTGGSETPYLVLEQIAPPFVNLNLYLHDARGGHLPEQEALEIVCKLGIIINKAHGVNILHNDINDQKLDNVFWDPEGRRIRLIDWGNADPNFGYDKGFIEKRSYMNDRDGLGRLLFRLVTGERFPVDKRVNPALWDRMSLTTRTAIERACDLKRNEDKSLYYNSKDKVDTGRMQVDLTLAYKAGKQLQAAEDYLTVAKSVKILPHVEWGDNDVMRRRSALIRTRVAGGESIDEIIKQATANVELIKNHSALP